MIFIDTNVFLRALVDKTDEASMPLRIQAMNLFRSIRDGELEATTSEVVLHELCFIATAKSHYSMDVLDVVGFVRAFLSLEGFRFAPGEKSLYVRALDIFEANPKLEFSDSVVAARAERLDVPLATFDRRLAKLPFVQIWNFEGVNE